MKKLVVMLLVMLSVGCASKTEYGDCIGITDKPQANLEYKYSVRNIVVGSVFFGTIFAPAIVLLNELQCPVGPKIVEGTHAK